MAGLKEGDLLSDTGSPTAGGGGDPTNIPSESQNIHYSVSVTVVLLSIQVQRRKTTFTHPQLVLVVVTPPVSSVSHSTHMYTSCSM